MRSPARVTEVSEPENPSPSRVIDTSIGKPGGPADVAISVDGAPTMRVDVKRTVPGAFSASETLDVGVDLGSPVSFDYFDRRPFAFEGEIGAVTVDLK